MFNTEQQNDKGIKELFDFTIASCDEKIEITSLVLEEK